MADAPKNASFPARSSEADPATPSKDAAAESDAQLVREVLAGKRARFEDLVRRYQNAVYAVALGYAKNRHRAEDIAQDVFVNAFKNLAQLREPERFASWLMQIVRNRASREHSQTAGRPEQPLDETFEPPARGEDPDTARTAEAFAKVEQLPEPYRSTILAKYQEGLSCKQIAARENVPIGTITSRLTRALVFLRTALREQ